MWAHLMRSLWPKSVTTYFIQNNPIGWGHSDLAVNLCGSSLKMRSLWYKSVTAFLIQTDSTKLPQIVMLEWPNCYYAYGINIIVHRELMVYIHMHVDSARYIKVWPYSDLPIDMHISSMNKVNKTLNCKHTYGSHYKY